MARSPLVEQRRKLKKLVLLQQSTNNMMIFLFGLYYVAISFYLKDKLQYFKTKEEKRIDRMRWMFRVSMECDSACISELRMDRATFRVLCDMIRDVGGLKATRNTSVEEVVAMFLYTLAHHKKSRTIGLLFHRSTETVSRQFHQVLLAVLRLHGILLKKPEPITQDCQDEKWKCFQGCLGALDGTLIKVTPPKEEKPRYRTRKGCISTNVLGVCCPNMQFIYVLSSWEGSAHDGRVLRDAIARPSGLKVRQGNFVVQCAMVHDREGLLCPKEDALVVSTNILGKTVDRILVDNGSFCNIIYKSALDQLGNLTKFIKPFETVLKGFGDYTVKAYGRIKLPVELVCSNDPKPMETDEPGTSCPAIPGGRVSERSSDDIEPRIGFEPGLDLDPRSEFGDRSKREATAPVEQMESIEIDPARPELEVRIGTSVPPDLKGDLVELLRKNIGSFAWSHKDMVGISPQHACHHLKIDPTRKPVHQKRRKFGPDKYTALDVEVKKLLDNKLIERAQDEPQWVANAVLVQKRNNTWRLCIDFTDLNDACPKDYFPMPHIDHLVDSTAGYEMISFMDAFAGYHQIPMAEIDIKHTSFHMEKDMFFWIRMPFGLKNAGATYQRLVNRMFADQIGRTMEVYIDDIVVKSLRKEDHVRDLAEMFAILEKYNMKLNPQKCSFGVSSGKFLGHIVSQRGVEANPAKIQAVLDMQEPRSVKQVQRLTGCLAALSRFISRLGDKSKPFFATIKNKKFTWTSESRVAFAKIKEYLSNPQILVKPVPGEKLFLYLAASEVALSAILVRAEGQDHLPIYYVSQALHDAKVRYTPLEKLAYALIMSVRKLRPYFFDHQVEVLTTLPLRNILQRPDTCGRLLKWSLEIAQYGITYAPRTASSSSVLSSSLESSSSMNS
ncbi:hypothetical protein OROHE_008037 [Orobanche hederae]